MVWLRVLEPTEILSIRLREPESVRAGDDAVEDRPAESEAAGLPREGANHFGAPTNLF